MKYTISIYGYGAETRIGNVPDEIANYIRETCDGEAMDYAEMLNNDEVPDEFKLIDNICDGYELSDIKELDAPDLSATIHITDKDGNDVFLDDALVIKNSVETKFYKMPEDDGKTYSVWQSINKGDYGSSDFETDGDFDPSKLSVNIAVIETKTTILKFISSIDYAGETILEAEEECSTGKAYEWIIA